MESADGQSRQFKNEKAVKEFDVVNIEVSEMHVTKIPRGVLVESTREILNSPDIPKIVVVSASLKEVSNTGHGETLMAKNMESSLRPRTRARNKLEMNIKVVPDSSSEEDVHVVDQEYLRT